MSLKVVGRIFDLKDLFDFIIGFQLFMTMAWFFWILNQTFWSLFQLFPTDKKGKQLFQFAMGGVLRNCTWLSRQPGEWLYYLNLLSYLLSFFLLVYSICSNQRLESMCEVGFDRNLLKIRHICVILKHSFFIKMYLQGGKTNSWVKIWVNVPKIDKRGKGCRSFLTRGYLRFLKFLKLDQQFQIIQYFTDADTKL